MPMSGWRWKRLLGCLALAGLALGSEVELNQNPDNQQQCQVGGDDAGQTDSETKLTVAGHVQ